MSKAEREDNYPKSNLSKISEDTSMDVPGSVTSVQIESDAKDGEEAHLKRELNFSELWGKHYWRQFTSLTPGLVLLFASGIQIYWTTYKLEEHLEKKHGNENEEVLLKIACWYGGAIIGSILGVCLVSLLLKRNIYYLGSALLIVSSFFFIKIGDFLYAGRIISGLNHGLIHLIVVIHASDNVSKRSRGAILRSISYVLTFSLFIAVITIASNGDDERTNISMGIYTLGYAIFALVLIPSATNESIPFLILHDKEEIAILKYVQLRSERSPTVQTQHGFDIIKETVLQDQKHSRNIFARDNLKPLALITGARLISLFLTNVPLMIHLLDKLVDEITPQNLSWLLSARIFCGFIPIFLASPTIRNGLIYKLAFGSGIVLLALEAFDGASVILDRLLVVTAVFFYLITTIGLDAIQYVQAAEAFPLTTKQYSFAFIAIVEHITHLLLIVFYYNNLISCLIYSCAVSLIFLSGFLHMYMPNISALSLRDARAKYL